MLKASPAHLYSTLTSGDSAGDTFLDILRRFPPSSILMTIT